MEEFLRLITGGVLLCWLLYWGAAMFHARWKKPQQRNTFSLFSYQAISKILLYALAIVIGMQFWGVVLFPFSAPLAVSIFGFFLVLCGVGMSILARRTLGTNWAPSYEFQIKTGQKLITSGMYHSVRHPIYTGIILLLVGTELVIGSYLWFGCALLFIGAYWQAKKEEELLTKNFGVAYLKYQKKTKMLIPFLV